MAVPKRKTSKAKRDKRRSHIGRWPVPLSPAVHSVVSRRVLTMLVRFVASIRAFRCSLSNNGRKMLPRKRLAGGVACVLPLM